MAPMKNKVELKQTTSTDQQGQRLDQALVQFWPEYSRSQFKLWIEQGAVRIDGEVVTKPRTLLQADQAIAVDAVLVARENWSAQAIDLNIVYEDDDLMVVNKPPGLVSHPGAGNPQGTLVNALLNHDQRLESVPRAGLIHRLDKETSGLLVIAKNLKAYHALNTLMQEREIKRTYLALVHGRIIRSGTIDKPIGRHPIHRTKMAIIENGRASVTHYKVLKRFNHHTLLEVDLQTGRTHQIRVHLASLRHPIVGDKTYGGKRPPQKDLSEPTKTALLHFNRQALHAQTLSFIHPTTQESLTFTAPLPEDMAALLETLAADQSQMP